MNKIGNIAMISDFHINNIYEDDIKKYLEKLRPKFRQMRLDLLRMRPSVRVKIEKLILHLRSQIIDLNQIYEEYPDDIKENNKSKQKRIENMVRDTRFNMSEYLEDMKSNYEKVVLYKFVRNNIITNNYK